jgi:hypothetical protein
VVSDVRARAQLLKPNRIFPLYSGATTRSFAKKFLVMKNSPRINTSFAALVLTLSTFGDSAVALGAATPAPIVVEPTTQTVFIGLDVSATVQGKPRRIVGMRGTRAELDVEGKIQRIEAEELSGFVFQRVPKIGPEFLEVTELKIEPGFRKGGVIDQAWTRARDAREMGKTVLDIAEGRADMDSQDPRIRNALQQMRLSGTPKDVMADVARRQIQAGEMSPEEIEDEARRNGLFDAINVSFLVRSPEPVSDTYAAIVCTIGSTKGGTYVGRMVFFCDVGNLQNKPRRVKTQFVGLPSGFQLVRTEFHFYSGTRELASNMAPNSTPVSERGASAFLTEQYVAVHENETIPAQVAWTPRVTENLQRLATKEKALMLRFSLDASGEVTAIDGNSPTKALQEHIAAVRFFPALENGKAVPSKLNVSLGDLVR